MKRLGITVTGQVQGVGFRPYVYRLANELRLTGWVQNQAVGVAIEIQGDDTHDFLQRLNQSLPPLAIIDTLQHTELPLHMLESEFIIRDSLTGIVTTKISPDVAICDNCLTDLFNKDSHYYHYPFVNCTQCGPRFSITRQLPYDRCNTSMAAFTMCETCRVDYENPDDRRYHAQPIACHSCGPRLSHSLEEIAMAIHNGKIVALKGLGGYQLICDARQQVVVKRLRQRKQRSRKPFAMMLLNTLSARQIVHCSDEVLQCLQSRARPIVLTQKKHLTDFHEIAPGINTLGIMLPSTPLHYLLFYHLLGTPAHLNWLQTANDMVLVMTSANLSDRPLITDDDEAQTMLAEIADLIVSYNRKIVTRVDDSVMGVINAIPYFIRRARGYALSGISLPNAIPPTLALGGHLKNTICVTRGNEAFVSQHIGDLDNKLTRQFFRETLQHMLSILDVKPQCVARDLHPDFYSSVVAAEFAVPAFPIQHHHAHLAACMLEHGVSGRALGLALDGFGLGDDAAAWGGELLLLENNSYQRLGSLYPLLQPGGDAAAREPWRVAISALYAMHKTAEINQRFAHINQAKNIVALLQSRNFCPPTSSCGRLFDAASALLGVCEKQDYEGEAAMLLESLVTQPFVDEQGWRMVNNHLNLLPLLENLLAYDQTTGANLFHGTLIAAFTDWLSHHAQAQQVTTIILGGGCFLNQVLSNGLMLNLRALGLKPYYPRQVAVNDGGLSLGQAWLAAQQFLGSKECV